MNIKMKRGLTLKLGLITAFLLLITSFLSPSFAGEDEEKLRVELIRLKEKEITDPAPVIYNSNGYIEISGRQKVFQVRKNGKKKDLGFRTPPADITYKEGIIDVEGNVAVLIGGNKTGFNFRSRQGTIIIRSQQEWKEKDKEAIVEPQNYVQLVPKVKERGFLALDDHGDLYEIHPPTKDNPYFIEEFIGEGPFQFLHRVGDVNYVTPWEKGEVYALKESQGEEASEYVAVSKGSSEFNALQKALANFPQQSQQKPPSMPYSLADYETLLKTAAEKVPELKKLWKWNQSALQKAYFGGGGLRGLFQFLDRQIVESAGDVKLLTKKIRRGELKIPSINHLLQPGADQDIWIPNGTSEEQLGTLGYAEWDLLEKDFYNATKKAGGSTLEKVQVSPTEILDPFGAIKDWYKRKLSFHLASKEVFESTKNTLQHDNTQTALALRFLRFAMENPEHTITEKSWENLQEVAKREQELPKNNYWLNKGIAKLFRASRGDIPRLVELLEKAHLLPNLLASGYTLASGKGFSDYYVNLTYPMIEEALTRPVPLSRKQEWIKFALLGFVPKDSHGQEPTKLEKSNWLFQRAPETLRQIVEDASSIKEFLDFYGLPDEAKLLRSIEPFIANAGFLAKQLIKPYRHLLAKKPDAAQYEENMNFFFGFDSWQEAKRPQTSGCSSLAKIAGAL